MGESPQRVTYEFGEFRIDAGRRLLQARTDGTALPLTAKVFDTLLYLVEHRGELVEKAALMKAIWPNVVVEENNLNQSVSALRRALGERAGEHRFIVTEAGRGYRFVADVKVVPASVTPTADADTPIDKSAAGDASPRQSVQFCTTPDGVGLAYAVTGTGSPILRTAHWLSHVEYDLQSPVYRHFLTDLSRHHTLVHYDHRGNGLSDRDVPEISLRTMLIDLETVADAAALERFALMGLSMGGPVSIAYAAKHPERLSHLVLHGTFARFVRPDSEVEAFATLMKEHWGRSNPAFRQMWTTSCMPDATPEEQHWFNELQRLTTSAENAVRIMRAIHAMDAMDLLGSIRVPTLVLHARDDATVPLEASRTMAARIPGARFVLLESRNHMLLEHDPASRRFKEELFAFLGG
jgi:pimeloyl-ACP methyl ester carboxylesterase/DNA-binding winged helix-turn-helix (wHTH) protein